MMLFSFIATTLMGIAVIVALTMEMQGWKPILAASAIGFIAAIPASLFVAKQILALQKTP